jgi:hypothetical protein
MDYKNTHFPQYRKLLNGLRFYKINSLNDFEELQLLGEKVYHFTIVAQQYPEKLKIMDMLSPISAHFLVSSEKEWNSNYSKL